MVYSFYWVRRVLVSEKINLYSNMAIRPIEEKVKQLRAKVYGKNIITILFRNKKKVYLEKKEKELFEEYKKLGNMLQSEYNFQNKINKKVAN